MKKIRYTTKFKKDFKRYSNQPRKIKKLWEVLALLANGQILPPELRAHELKGNHKGFMECHIESDFLLIWMDETQQEIVAVRLGSHAELFDL